MIEYPTILFSDKYLILFVIHYKILPFKDEYSEMCIPLTNNLKNVIECQVNRNMFFHIK